MFLCQINDIRSEMMQTVILTSLAATSIHIHLHTAFNICVLSQVAGDLQWMQQ